MEIQQTSQEIQFCFCFFLHSKQILLWKSSPWKLHSIPLWFLSICPQFVNCFCGYHAWQDNRHLGLHVLLTEGVVGAQHGAAPGQHRLVTVLVFQNHRELGGTVWWIFIPPSEIISPSQLSALQSCGAHQTVFKAVRLLSIESSSQFLSTRKLCNWL